MLYQHIYFYIKKYIIAKMLCKAAFIGIGTIFLQKSIIKSENRTKIQKEGLLC